MRMLRLVPILLGLALVAGPALAEEVIYFTNGSSMPIRAHSIKDGMIRVDLGSNASMAFPDSVIDRIEKAGQHVSLDSDNSMNRRGSATGPRSTPRQAPRINPQALAGNAARRDPDVEVGSDGVTYHRPMKGSANPRKRDFKVAGNQQARNGRQAGNGGIRTNRGMGGRTIVGPNAPSNRRPSHETFQATGSYPYAQEAAAAAGNASGSGGSKED